MRGRMNEPSESDITAAVRAYRSGRTGPVPPRSTDDDHGRANRPPWRASSRLVGAHTACRECIGSINKRYCRSEHCHVPAYRAHAGRGIYFEGDAVDDRGPEIRDRDWPGRVRAYRKAFHRSPAGRFWRLKGSTWVFLCGLVITAGVLSYQAHVNQQRLIERLSFSSQFKVE